MNVSQGYPLWAMDGAGKAHAVVGWDEYGYPELVPLDGSVGGVLSRRDEAGYVFTTTEPAAGPRTEGTSMAARYHALVKRMGALADRLVEQDMDTLVAGLIREELAK